MGDAQPGLKIVQGTLRQALLERPDDLDLK